MKLNGTRFAMIILILAIAFADYFLLQSEDSSTTPSQSFTETNQKIFITAGK
jgi:hypothetical protein